MSDTLRADLVALLAAHGVPGAELVADPTRAGSMKPNLDAASACLDIALDYLIDARAHLGTEYAPTLRAAHEQLIQEAARLRGLIIEREDMAAPRQAHRS